MADNWREKRADGRTESWVTKRRWEVKDVNTLRGFRNGCTKDRGSACGIVLKVGTTEEVGFAVCKVALLLVKGCAMQAEIKGCVFLGYGRFNDLFYRVSCHAGV